MKKALLFLLILCLAVFACGCDKNETKVKNRTYDEAEVLAAAEDLIGRSELFNLIYYGSGIPAKEEQPKTSAGYTEADPDFLSAHGIDSIETLKTKTKEVYTEGASTSIFNAVLNVVYDGETIVGYKRYMEDAGTVYVRTGAENQLPDRVTYHYDTLKVDHVEGEIIFVTLTVTVQNDEGKTQDKTKTVRLLEEADGFRLDSMTYVKYYAK